MLTEEQKRGERMQGKKKKEELTPEEYRQQAREFLQYRGGKEWIILSLKDTVTRMPGIVPQQRGHL